MIKIKYLGNFGNHLFQYAFARMLAEKFNYKLASDLPKNQILSTTECSTTQSFDTQPIILRDDFFKFPSDLKESTYLLDGYFQKFGFYKHKQDVIKNFFIYNRSNIATNKKDICLSVRLGDYKSYNWIIHPDYYKNILENENFEEIYLITDDPKNIYIRNLQRKYKIKNISANATNDFYNLMSFDKVILSNSTFAWWCMFLGGSSKVYTFKRWIEPISSQAENLSNLPNSIIVDEKYHHEVGHI
jgi:hypothetical protein